MIRSVLSLMLPLALVACGGGAATQAVEGQGELAYYDSKGGEHRLAGNDKVKLEVLNGFVAVRVDFEDGSYFIFDADHVKDDIFTIQRKQGSVRVLAGEPVDFKFERGTVRVGDDGVVIDIVGTAKGTNVRDTFGYRFSTTS